MAAGLTSELSAESAPTSAASPPEDLSVAEPEGDPSLGREKPLNATTRPPMPDSRLPVALAGDQSASPSGQLLSAIERHYQALASERPPQSHLEELFLGQIARHAAHLEWSDECAISILDAAAASGEPTAPQSRIGYQLAALRSPAQMSLLRYQSVHQRGLALAVREWIRVQAQASSVTIPQIFNDEAACVDHLRQWQSRQPWTCPACGSQQRCWLIERSIYECECGRQYSLREGTVFRQSHVPLIIWFRVAAAVICSPTQRATELARQLNFARAQTIADLMRKTREALRSPDAERLLAGIPELVLDHLSQVLDK